MKNRREKFSVTNNNEYEQGKHKIRILFVGCDYSSCSGGIAISRRNVYLLKEYFGDENVIEYKLAHSNNKYLNLLRLVCLQINNVSILTHVELKKIINENYIKYVFCDESDLGIFSKRFIRDNNFIFFFHNVEAVYTNSQLTALWDSFSLKGKLYELYRKNAVKLVEKRNCLLSALNITLNKRDSDELKKLYGRGADLILPSSMKDTYRKYDESDIPKIGGGYMLFVGSDFYGSTQGLFDFIEKCLPSINCKLVIVGNGMERYRNKFDTDKAEFVGFVEDIGPYYAGAKAVVLPIISGSGMKTKTCEALMHGKILFGTDEAFEGFDHINEADCVLCNSHSEFINKINDFIENDKISGSDSKFSSKSRAVFEKYYSNEVVYKLFKDKMDILTKGR